MKKYLLIIAGIALTPQAAAEDISQTIDASSDGLISISNVEGEVEVIGWSRNEVEVTGTLGDDVDEFVFERQGSRVVIKVKTRDRHWGSNDMSSDIYVKVPEDSSLEIGTVSADITVEGVKGEQELEAISGDIDTKSFGPTIEAASVSGDIDIEGNGQESETEAASVSGDVTITGLSGEFEAESVSGDVEVTGAEADRVSIETVNGDIVYNGVLRNGGKLGVDTVNGSVDVKFDGDVSARIDVETFNGRIKNCFGPEAARTSRYAPGWELSFTEGNGDGRVVIGTLNGGVKLCKE